MNDRMRRIHLIHLVGIGGSGMGGIAEVLLNLGYEVQGSDLKANAVTQRLARLGARDLHRPCGRAPRQRGRGRGFERRQPRQPGSGGRAGEPHSRGAARGDAGRTDALPLFDRGRGHPRQDHHDQPGRERAGRRRPRPDLRHRRTAQERRQQCAPRRWPLPGRGGRRERCLVHAPAADDRDRHQHRQRPPRDARRRFLAAEAEFRRFSAQPAVLRPRRAVRRRRRACAAFSTPSAGPSSPTASPRAPTSAPSTWCATACSRDIQALRAGPRAARPDDQSAGTAQCAEFAGGGRRRHRARHRRCGHPESAGAISRASTGGCSRSARSTGRAGARCVVDDYGHHPTEVAATIDAVRQGWPRAGWCSHFNRTATPARATCWTISAAP